MEMSSPGKNGGADGIASGWKQERLEADSLLRSLHEAHCEDEEHRRWLLRRWPEWPKEGLAGSVAGAERFIPECFLRDGEDDFDNGVSIIGSVIFLQFVKDISGDLQSVKELISGGLGFLQEEEEGEEGKEEEEEEEEDHEGDGRLDLARSVARLSDDGFIESIPLLVPKLQRKALQSVLSILSRRPREARNRPWLVEKVNQLWRAFLEAHSREKKGASRSQLEEILRIFRNPKSFREEKLPGELVVEEASCPWSAAHSAFTESQLEQLPLQCLHVMLEALLEKPPAVTVGVLPVGRSKERLVKSILNKAKAFLSSDEAEPLPEPLRNALVVMSLSARHAFGDDGNLINFLGPISLESTLLQGSLLSALTDLRTLSYENLKVAYRVLIGAPKLYRKKHPVNLRYPVRRMLLECLLRSEVRPVPEKVKAAAEKITTLALRQPDAGQLEPLPESDVREQAALADGARAEVEVESTLQISSHLLQIMYNWKEILSQRSSEAQALQRPSPAPDVMPLSLVHGTVNGTVDEASTTSEMTLDVGIRSDMDVEHVDGERLTAHLTNGEKCDKEAVTIPFVSDLLDGTVKSAQEDGKDALRAEETDVGMIAVTEEAAEEEEEDKEEEEVEDLCLKRIADDAAEVGYALVGSAMERTARASGVSLKRPVRKYLLRGTTKKVRTEAGEGMNDEQHQLAMILQIAEKIPAISPRVMGNVKRRLGMG